MSSQLQDHIDEEAASDNAYGVAIALVGQCCELIVQNAGKWHELDDACIEISLKNISQARDIIRVMQDTFVAYPLIRHAAERLSTVAAYAEALIIPTLVLQGHVSNRKVITYLIRNPRTKLVKIGKTTDLSTRISALQCGAGAPLEIVQTIECDCEKELHDRFSDFRVHGEWFCDPDCVISNFVRARRAMAGAL